MDGKVIKICGYLILVWTFLDSRCFQDVFFSAQQQTVMTAHVYNNVLLWYDLTRSKWITCYSVQPNTNPPSAAAPITESFISVYIGGTYASGR